MTRFVFYVCVIVFVHVSAHHLCAGVSSSRQTIQTGCVACTAALRGRVSPCAEAQGENVCWNGRAQARISSQKSEEIFTRVSGGPGPSPSPGDACARQRGPGTRSKCNRFYKAHRQYQRNAACGHHASSYQESALRPGHHIHPAQSYGLRMMESRRFSCHRKSRGRKSKRRQHCDQRTTRAMKSPAQ